MTRNWSHIFKTKDKSYSQIWCDRAIQICVDTERHCKLGSTHPLYPSSHVFLIGIVGGGVQLGPLGIAATNRPIVPSPGDYDDGEIGGMMIGRRNRSTRRKPTPVPLCPPQIPHALPGCEPGPPRW
jgi:hypothetical protein